MLFRRAHRKNHLLDISKQYGLSEKLVEEYHDLFMEYKIPICWTKKRSKRAEKIVMISTHGYWGDPPPAGVPDTGGQTYYVLEVSKAWARQNRTIIIIARWFEPYPRVELFGKNVWLVRIKAGGDDFVRKEDIYPLVPEMAEASTAIAALFGADAVVGHYADGMAGAVEAADRLEIPVINIPHSIGIRKVKTLGFDPKDPETWFDSHYNFWIREGFELTTLRGSNFEIANTPAEPAIFKDYYDAEFPHIVLPAGAGEDYFNAYKVKKGSTLLDRFNITSKKYFIFFGRLSESKNIHGVVAVYGEARRLNPEKMAKIKLVIVGGEPDNPQGEERSVEKQITEMMNEYDLTKNDVIRIPSQDWSTLSILAANSLLYIGMQVMEPFGMAAAEAMAAGVPVVISKVAGIARWLKDGNNGLIVDPQDPRGVAKRVVELLSNKKNSANLSLNGNRLAKDCFSWPGIAKTLGKLIDTLQQGNSPKIMDNFESYSNIFNKRSGRAYHRLAFVWRGDLPIIREKHKKAAIALVPHISAAAKEAKQRNERLVVALGGESGAGKSEVAEYLRYAIRRNGIRGVTLPGDAFFKLTPKENHNTRLKAYNDGQLDRYLGPSEVDLERLETVLADCKKGDTEEVFIPSDCRQLGSRRYDNVPLSLNNANVIIVDLTYSLLLKNIDLKVFFESDYKKRTEEIKERNLARDPDQDFDFILKVLEIEHKIIQGLKEKANLIVTNDYNLAVAIP